MALIQRGQAGHRHVSMALAPCVTRACLNAGDERFRALACVPLLHRHRPAGAQPPCAQQMRIVQLWQPSLKHVQHRCESKGLGFGV